MLSAFKRPPQAYGASAPVETPYQRASQVWDDRQGSAVAHANNWRLACLASLAITAVITVAYIADRGNTHVVTYVVPVDSYGRPGAIELAGKTYQPTKAEAGYFLADWIGWARGRSPSDPIVNNQNMIKAYGFVDGLGRTQLGDMFRAADTAAKTEGGAPAVTVQVRSVIQLSPSSYRVEWTEMTFRQGQPAANTRWAGIFSTVVKPPRDEAAMRRNPLGLFINSVQISQELN